MHYRRISYRYSVHRLGVPQFGDLRLERLPFSIAEPVWRPPADLYECTDEFVIKIEIPGIRDDDFGISLYEDAVVIEGTRSAPLPAPDARVLALEIRYGPFRLEVGLPGGIDREAVKARYDAGFLYVQLPKRGATR